MYGLSLQKNSEEQSKFVEGEILKQKSEFIKENQDHEHQVAVHLPDSIAGAKKDSIFQENTIAERDVLDDILSKRSRIKKESKPKFVDNIAAKNRMQKDSTLYNDSYVIVNGRRIDTMEEALEVTRYSLQVVANNMYETLSQPQVMDNVDN